jgi:hypothetical protein
MSSFKKPSLSYAHVFGSPAVLQVALSPGMFHAGADAVDESPITSSLTDLLIDASLWASHSLDVASLHELLVYSGTNYITTVACD